MESTGRDESSKGRRPRPDEAREAVELAGSPDLERFPTLRFRNMRAGLKLGISFPAATGSFNGGFTAMLVAPDNRKLNVEDYLKLHELEALAEPFTYRDPDTDIRENTESFLRALEALLDKDLEPIFDGKQLQATPIDWMGYR